MKKKFMFPFICLLMGMNMLFGEWKSWETPPLNGELYMWVFLTDSEYPPYRQILNITRFNSDDPKYQAEHNGWWTVDEISLWQWLHEGNALMGNLSSTATEINLSKNFTNNSKCHSCDEKPTHGDLYMYIISMDQSFSHLVPYKELIVIERFEEENFKNLLCKEWWELSKKNIISLFKEGYPLIYLLN